MPATASKQADAARAKSDGIQTTVVLPAYNEGAALPHVLDELEASLDQSYEILVVPPELGEAAQTAAPTVARVLVTTPSGAAAAFADLVQSLEAGNELTAERVESMR